MLDKLVTVTLDKERHLRLTLKGMMEFEKITGKNLLKGFTFDDLTISDSATLMWACLIHEDKDLTLDDVLCMVDLSNYVAVMEAIIGCISQSLPDVEAGGNPLVETPQAG